MSLSHSKLFSDFPLHSEKKPLSLLNLLLPIQSLTSAPTTFPFAPLASFCSSPSLTSFVLTLLSTYYAPPPDIFMISSLISFILSLKYHLNLSLLFKSTPPHRTLLIHLVTLFFNHNINQNLI